MHTKEMRRILEGPDEETLFDAFLHAYDMQPRYACFTVNEPIIGKSYAPVTIYTILQGIEHERKSGYSYNIHGHFPGNDAEFTAHYNVKARQGIIIF